MARMCPHGRPTPQMCPHCLGVNGAVRITPLFPIGQRVMNRWTGRKGVVVGDRDGNATTAVVHVEFENKDGLASSPVCCLPESLKKI